MTTNKVMDKQKNDMLERILFDYPDVKRDVLKRHFVEQMLDAYLADPDTFNKKTTELRKRQKKGDEPQPKHLPEEIVCISKEGDETKQEQNLTLNNSGYITA